MLARLLRWTVDSVAEREGSAPTEIAVTHPANWGAYKTDLLRQAMRLADLDVDITLTEPEAAAISYAATERVAPGDVVAVYDLGGGTFDAAVLRKTADGFEILGDPEGIERLGGIDFDQAVFAFVSEALDGAVTKLDPAEPGTLAALARLRQECVDAKEALSTDTETVVPVILPGLQTEVLITRAEFEAMIRPTLADTLTALRRALRSAHVDPGDVKAVLLVGGSSRIPLVADLVSHELERPVAVDLHPKHAVAQGAAIAADDGRDNVIVPLWPDFTPPVDPVEDAPSAVEPLVEPAAAPPAPPAPPPPPSVPAPTPVPASADLAPPPHSPAAPPPPVTAAAHDSTPPRGRRGILIGSIAAALVVIAGAAAFALTRDSGGGATAAGCPPAGKPAVCISDVNVSGQSILATFTSHDVQIADPFSGEAGPSIRSSSSTRRTRAAGACGDRTHRSAIPVVSCGGSA